jgi:hypothetical protein
VNLGDLTVSIGADSSDLTGKLSAAADDVMKFGAIAGGASTIASTALGVLQGAFEELVTLIPDATAKAADFARSIDEVSQKTGLSDQFIMAMTPAMNQVGLSAQNLTMGFRTLAKDIQAAQNPASKQAEMFRELGLSANQLSDPGQALSLIADRLAILPDGFEKTTLAGELFSRTGINLIPILNKGAEGFAESGAKAQQMGLILSSSSMAALEALKTSYVDAATATDSFSTHLGIAFAPIMQAFNELKVSASSLGITFVDNLGQSMLTLTARAQGLYGFLKEQAALPLSAGIDGLMAVYKKWDDQTTANVASIRAQSVALVDSGNVFTNADAQVAAYYARLQSLGDAQEKIGVALRNTAVAGQQADASEYGTKNLKEAIVLSGQFLTTITPAGMMTEVEKGNQIVEGAMRDRTIAITEYGKAAVDAANRVNAMFGSGTTDPSQGNNQEQLGMQALTTFKQVQATNALRLQDEVTTDAAVMAIQQELYKNESSFIGAADAARQVANTHLDAMQAQQAQALKTQLDSGVIDYQSYQSRLSALETEGTAKRMQIISQYPTFMEKQLGDLVNANTFSMSQISTTFTQSMSKMIIEGGNLQKAWVQIQESLVQSALNAGIQMLAQAALNFLKETALAQVMEEAKTALFGVGATARAGIGLAETEGVSANAMSQLGAMAAMANASTGIMAAVVNEIASVYAIIGAALASNPLTIELAAPFEYASGEIEGSGAAAVSIAEGAIQGTVGTAIVALGGGSVPKLAEGGIVNWPTLAMVGEAGPEAVIPLNQLGNMGGSGSGGPLTVQILLDGKMIANSTLEKMPRLVRYRTGLR